MPDGADQEGNESGHGTTDMGSRGAVNMSAEEVVNWDVPFAGELEPISTVPPVGVEVSVCKALKMLVGSSKIRIYDLQVISAKAPRTYSKITRKTRRNVTMKGNRSIDIDSARMSAVSENEVTDSSRKADSIITGRMNSSDVMVRRNITPKTARIL